MMRNSTEHAQICSQLVEFGVAFAVSRFTDPGLSGVAGECDPDAFFDAEESEEPARDIQGAKLLMPITWLSRRVNRRSSWCSPADLPGSNYPKMVFPRRPFGTNTIAGEISSIASGGEILVNVGLQRALAWIEAQGLSGFGDDVGCRVEEVPRQHFVAFRVLPARQAAVPQMKQLVGYVSQAGCRGHMLAHPFGGMRPECLRVVALFQKTRPSSRSSLRAAVRHPRRPHSGRRISSPGASVG